jgi:hypothetical protein
VRTLNRRLGQRADFLNLIPGELVFPWLLTAIGGYVLLNGVFGLNWIWTGTLVAWGCLSWLLLVGRRPHRFFGQMLTPPCLARVRLKRE